jgi:hypothetical protein
MIQFNDQDLDRFRMKPGGGVVPQSTMSLLK